MNSIQVTGVSYRYAKQSVLNDISLTVPQGSIYGFLGANGAGKTTTLKLLPGLLKKQKGEIKIFDKTIEKNRIEILKDIGSLIETPSIYSHLTATENCMVWQKVYNCNSKRINEVLKVVGLAGTGKKRAGQFSLGMKQKLGIAIALLTDPKLLILDEPTNGLDPNGIIEIRALLQSLNKEHGTTIIISSHILAEIEKSVTHLGIIHQGKMLFEGTFQDLLNKQTDSGKTVFRTSNNALATSLLDVNCVKKLDGFEINGLDKDKIAALVSALVKNEIDIYEVATKKTDLETIFMEVITH